MGSRSSVLEVANPNIRKAAQELVFEAIGVK